MRKRRSARKLHTSSLGEKWDNFRNLSLFKKILLLGGVGLGILLIIALVTTVLFANQLSSKERLMNRSSTGVTLQDRNGETFYEFYNPRSDTYVQLNQIAKVTQQAAIASEDQDFYEHSGFSITGIGNAILENIRPGGLDSGGSTITQQLIKNALLTSDRSYLRKYQELVLAVVIEQRYSKDEILEMYLNSVYFGEGYFGIEDAARGYFGISANELTVAQSAMLIGLLPAPSYYSPTSGDPEEAKIRQEYVLGRMVEDGYISQEQADQAKAAELSYRPQDSQDEFKAPHFALMVKRELEERYGEEQVARSGFIVRTTLDLSQQTAAQQAVEGHVNSLGYANVGNGAAVVIDPQTGQIRALVGSKNYANEKFGAVNMAITPRQPGSSFKPIVYGTGIEEKTISAATILHDEPTDFGGGYTPENYDLGYRGDVTVRQALANSLNIPAVEALDIIGIQDVLDQAEELGISTLDQSPSDYGLSLALGTGSVRLTELTNAYATFGNQGQRNEVHTILSITDKYEDEVYTADPDTDSAISAETSYIMSSILSDNEARAATFGSSLTVFGHDVAVKTGTTEEYSDALTIGYTPSLAIGVWVGNNDNSPMQAIAGSIGAGPIWQGLMTQFLANTPNEPFSVPSSLVTRPICIGTGAVAEFEAGQPTYTEYFRPGTVPNQRCNTERPEPEQPEARPEDEDEEEEEQPTEDEEETTDEPLPGDTDDTTQPDSGNGDSTSPDGGSGNDDGTNNGNNNGGSNDNPDLLQNR